MTTEASDLGSGISIDILSKSFHFLRSEAGRTR